MIIKARTEPLPLKILRILKSRMEFSEKDEQHYFTMDKGYQGELQFDAMLEKMNEGLIVVINDLLLEHQNTLFQLDSVLIAGDNIYPINIKNFENDYVIKDDKWYRHPATEINSPLNQLNKSNTLFSRLISDLGFTYNVEPYLAFVNPLFFLYQAPTNLPAIFPSQMNRFFKKLNSISQKSKATNRNITVAEQLASFHIEKNPFERIPSYTYGGLKKGLIGVCGHSFVSKCTGKVVICNICDCEESIESVVLRSVEELNILFPDMKITTALVYEWCGFIISKKAIRRILKKHFKIMGHGKYSYYV